MRITVSSFVSRGLTQPSALEFRKAVNIGINPARGVLRRLVRSTVLPGRFVAAAAESNNRSNAANRSVCDAGGAALPYRPLARSLTHSLTRSLVRWLAAATTTEPTPATESVAAAAACQAGPSEARERASDKALTYVVRYIRIDLPECVCIHSR